jgi:hypothetical protein
MKDETMVFISTNIRLPNCCGGPETRTNFRKIFATILYVPPNCGGGAKRQEKKTNRTKT